MVVWNIACGIVLGMVVMAVLRWAWGFVQECADQRRADDDAIARLNLKQLHYLAPGTRRDDKTEPGAPQPNPEDIAAARPIMDSTRRMIEQTAAGVAVVVWNQRRARRLAALAKSLPSGGGLSATQLAGIVSAAVPEDGLQLRTAAEARELHVSVLQSLAHSFNQARRA